MEGTLKMQVSHQFFYGKDRFYPENDLATVMADLMRADTFSLEELNVMREKLGMVVEIVPVSLEAFTARKERKKERQDARQKARDGRKKKKRIKPSKEPVHAAPVQVQSPSPLEPGPEGGADQGVVHPDQDGI